MTPPVDALMRHRPAAGNQAHPSGVLHDWQRCALLDALAGRLIALRAAGLRPHVITFAWNQWARVNNVVDDQFRVRRGQREAFLAMSDALRGANNALDARSGDGLSPVQVIRWVKAQQQELEPA